MTNPNGDRFCTRCGAMLPKDSTFCPYCGVPADGGENPYKSSEPNKAYTGVYPLGSTPQLMQLYIFGALILGLMIIMMSQMINEEMWDEIWGGQIAYNASMNTLFLIEGICLIVSAFLTFQCRKHVKALTNYKAAFNYCLLATVVLIPMIMDIVGIILIIMGVLMTHRLYKYRTYFTS